MAHIRPNYQFILSGTRAVSRQHGKYSKHRCLQPFLFSYHDLYILLFLHTIVFLYIFMFLLYMFYIVYLFVSVLAKLETYQTIIVSAL